MIQSNCDARSHVLHVHLDGSEQLCLTAVGHHRRSLSHPIRVVGGVAVEHLLVTIGVLLQLGGSVLTEQLMDYVAVLLGARGEQRLVGEVGQAAQGMKAA